MMKKRLFAALLTILMMFALTANVLAEDFSVRIKRIYAEEALEVLIAAQEELDGEKAGTAGYEIALTKHYEATADAIYTEIIYQGFLTSNDMISHSDIITSAAQFHSSEAQIKLNEALETEQKAILAATAAAVDRAREKKSTDEFYTAVDDYKEAEAIYQLVEQKKLDANLILEAADGYSSRDVVEDYPSLLIVLEEELAALAQAEPRTYVEYAIADLNLNISVPSDWTTVTRTIQEGDPALDMFGMTAEEVKQTLIGNDIYLDSFSDNSTYEIDISMLDAKGDTDFNDMSEEELKETAERYFEADEAQSTDTTHTGYSIYTHPQTKFIVLDYKQNDGEDERYGQLYLTKYNGQTISIVLQSNDIELSDSAKLICKKVVDSITFLEPSNTQDSSSIAFRFEKALIIIGCVTAAAVVVSIVLIVFILKKRKKAAAAGKAASVYPQPAPMQTAAAQPASAQSVGLPPNENAIKLRQLKELYDTGVITGEEFAAKKAQLLEKL